MTQVLTLFSKGISDYDLDSFSDGDNLADAFDLDSDGDACFDVIEAGLDPDNDGRLQQAPLTVDDNTVDDISLVIGPITIPCKRLRQ